MGFISKRDKKAMGSVLAEQAEYICAVLLAERQQKEEQQEGLNGIIVRKFKDYYSFKKYSNDIAEHLPLADAKEEYYKTGGLCDQGVYIYHWRRVGHVVRGYFE